MFLKIISPLKPLRNRRGTGLFLYLKNLFASKSSVCFANFAVKCSIYKNVSYSCHSCKFVSKSFVLLSFIIHNSSFIIVLIGSYLRNLLDFALSLEKAFSLCSLCKALLCELCGASLSLSSIVKSSLIINLK